MNLFKAALPHTDADEVTHHEAFNAVGKLCNAWAGGWAHPQTREVQAADADARTGPSRSPANPLEECRHPPRERNGHRQHCTQHAP